MSESNTPALTPVNLPPKPERMTADEATKIAGALQRLNEIQNAPNIVALNAPNKDKQEVTDLINYLSETLIKHAKELVGCWFVIKGEYEPLVRALVPAFQRTLAFAKVEEQKNKVNPAAPQNT